MELTRAERVRRALTYQEVDRLPTQFNYTGSMGESLAQHFGVDLPGDVSANRAMHRILRGGKAVKDRMILQRRRLEAIAALRDSASDDTGRQFWASRHSAEMNTAGC